MSASPPGGRSRLLALTLAAGLSVGLGATLAPAAVAAPGDVPAAPAPTASRADATAAIAGAAKNRDDKLGQHDRRLLAKAEAARQPTVVAMFTTAPGEAPEVAASLERLGGLVGYRNDRLDYVRASVPTAKVSAAAALEAVTAVDLNETILLGDPRGSSGTDAAGAAAATGPGAGTPDDNAYLPTNEIGAVAFKTAHPEWDGRGVTVGVMDSGVDLDHPALQTTTTGERKIVDWVTATDPVADNDRTWRPMQTAVEGPTFTYETQTWTAPAGSYLVNHFAESSTGGGEVGGDVNRDGDTSDLFGVLYRASDNAIWVDANEDRTFADAELIRPYRVAHEVGHFGTDDPATPVSERMPFVVEYRKGVKLASGGTADFVNIGIVSAAHGSHVAGIVAGNGLFGGAMDGAAPGAQIVSSRACLFTGGCTALALTEGMIDLVAKRGVDIVNMSIGGLPALNDGNNARATLYDNLIREYGVQIVLSAGNSGPGVNTIGDPSVSTDAVSVGAAVSKATWAANYGSQVSAAMNMFNFSSRGPREDGGLKPNITAPGSAISTVPIWQPGTPVAEAGYALPPGYAMFNGTSMAAPQAAGGAALLVSAGKATDKAFTPAALRKAMYSTAVFNTSVPAVAQGHGQLNVPKAWALLSKTGLTTRPYSVSAPVCTELSAFLATPHRGAGIYNRCGATSGGHAAGAAKYYDVVVTRKEGPAGGVRHDLTWLGNDGTFTAVRSVKLPLNVPTTVQVKAQSGAGLHSAILRIDDPGTPGLDAAMMAAVVVATPLATPSYGASLSGSVERNRTTSLFVHVPPGTAALQVNLSGIAANSQTRFIAFHPYGVPFESTSSLGCFTNFSDEKACNPRSRSYANPTPGVWEIEVEARRTSPHLVNPFALTVSAQAVEVSASPAVLGSVVRGVPTPVTFTLKNLFGTVTATPQGGPLASVKSGRPDIAAGGTQEFTVEVPIGASRFEAKIGSTSDRAADLDLYVLRGGVVVGQNADGDSEEAVALSNPPAGSYTVRVVGYAVPAKTTAYDYRDAFVAPALGSVSVPATPVTLEAGASQDVTGSVVAEAAPADGRQLFGEVSLVAGSGAVVGRGGVLIDGVTTP